MGYELHLVKKGDWSDKVNVFTQAEYDAILKKHQADWLYFDGKSITVKNPSKVQIVEVVGIAKGFGWSVQGDDGETYGEDASPVREPASFLPGFTEWLNKTIERFLGPKGKGQSANDIACPFNVGDRVRTMHRSGGVVIEVDPGGNHGMGSIKVRFPDGTVIGSMFTAHGLEKEE